MPPTKHIKGHKDAKDLVIYGEGRTCLAPGKVRMLSVTAKNPR